MLSSDFFRGTGGFFRRSARLFTKKVLFRPKSHQRLFLRYRWNLGRFPRERWIFPREKLAVLVDSCSFFSEQAMEIAKGKPRALRSPAIVPRLQVDRRSLRVVDDRAAHVARSGYPNLRCTSHPASTSAGCTHTALRTPEP
jgi:hypothetical protein